MGQEMGCHVADHHGDYVRVWSNLSMVPFCHCPLPERVWRPSAFRCAAMAARLIPWARIARSRAVIAALSVPGVGTGLPGSPGTAGDTAVCCITVLLAYDISGVGGTGLAVVGGQSCSCASVALSCITVFSSCNNSATGCAGASGAG